MNTTTPLFLAEPFKSAWQNQNVFAEVKKISDAADGKNIFREKEGRRTLRFTFKGKNNSQSYFLKYHQGVGWKEIFKNLVQGREPILGASNEYYAAVKLKLLGVDTLTPVAYGYRGKNPAVKESFLITEDLVNTISLEDYCRHWSIKRPPFNIKQALIKKVANMTKQMHDQGINHRDFYICHFLLENSAETKIEKQENFHCYLIDLHRCQIRNKIPQRWLIKDLGGLLYSTMDIGLTSRDYFRFIKKYTGRPLRLSLQDPMWKEVLVNAIKLYQKDFGKNPRPVFKKTIFKAGR